MTLLEVDDIKKQYGQLVAVNEVSFEIERGELPALIGPNGAGKTTLYNLLTGKVASTAGRIIFNGEDVTEQSTYERTRLGLGRSFQITSVFPELSVRQNLRAPVVARSDQRWNPVDRIEEKRALNEAAERYLDLLNLSNLAETEAATLSYGDKRRVEIGIALATEPDLLLLDEPTAGMNPIETDSMVDLIKRLDEETDTTFMVTEHDMDVVFSIASRILVLDRGELIADDDPEVVRHQDRVKSAYLGEEVEA